MLSGRELALGIVGAWRLVRGDRTALLCFDRTPAGFRRSFWVYVLLAPPQAVLVAINYAQLKIDPIPFELVLLQIGFYVLDVLLLPAVLSEFALRAGRVPQFVAFTVAYNYAQVLLVGLWLAVMGIANMMGDAGAVLLQLVALGLSLAYQYRVARIAFDLDWLFAALLVLLSLGLSLALQAINSSLLQAFCPPGA